jgi:hypothetical protein
MDNNDKEILTSLVQDGDVNGILNYMAKFLMIPALEIKLKQPIMKTDCFKTYQDKINFIKKINDVVEDPVHEEFRSDIYHLSRCLEVECEFSEYGYTRTYNTYDSDLFIELLNAKPDLLANERYVVYFFEYVTATYNDEIGLKYMLDILEHNNMSLYNYVIKKNYVYDHTEMRCDIHSLEYGNFEIFKIVMSHIKASFPTYDKTKLVYYLNNPKVDYKSHAWYDKKCAKKGEMIEFVNDLFN